MYSGEKWIQFNFFNYVTKALPCEINYSDFTKGIHLCSSGYNRIVIGKEDGSVTFLSDQFTATSYQLFSQRLTHVYNLKDRNILISFGSDSTFNETTMKVWNFDKIDKTGNPFCCKLQHLNLDHTVGEMTCIDVNETASVIVCGFTSGRIEMLYNDITRVKKSRVQTLCSENDSITGLAIKHLDSSVVIFVTTKSSVFSLSWNFKDNKCFKNVIDDSFGCEMGCMAMGNYLVNKRCFVALKNMISFCFDDVKAESIPSFGNITRLFYVRGFIVALWNDKSTSSVIAEARPADYKRLLRKVNITIYDIRNELIAYSESIPSVIGIVDQFGATCLILNNGQIAMLTEKILKEKFEILLNRQYYDTAVRLAKNSDLPHHEMVKIVQKCGDFLYEKGNMNQAIKRYITTIGTVEPSYVIRKYLDAKNVENLSEYLLELHRRKTATRDHTTLLFNCHARIKNPAKIEEFINLLSGVHDFDVVIAIDVCRQVKFFNYALDLAKSHKMHEKWIAIQLEDLHNYSEVVDYLLSIDPNESWSIVSARSDELAANCSDRFNELMCFLWDSLYGCDSGGLFEWKNFLDDTINIMRSLSTQMTLDFLHHVSKMSVEVKKYVSFCVLDFSLLKYNELLSNQPPKIEETSSMKRILLEIIQEMISSDSFYEKILSLCQQHCFTEGIMLLYRSKSLYDQILQHYIKENDNDKVIQCCREYGDKFPQLWSQALPFLITRATADADYIANILEMVEDNSYVSGLEVIQTLLQSKEVKFGAIKNYIIKCHEKQESFIEKQEKEIASLKSNIDSTKKKIENIRSGVHVFMTLSCSVCGTHLTLPSIHFFCQHSFHKSCYESHSNVESLCPFCVPDKELHEQMIVQKHDLQDAQDNFFEYVDSSKDKFDTISKFIGMGIMTHEHELEENENKELEKQIKIDELQAKLNQIANIF